MDKSSKSELEKCLDGEFYNCHDSIFIEYKAKARRLIKEYRNLDYLDKEGKRKILEQLFNKIGSNVLVGDDFRCDYGINISIGDNVSINMNCTFVDCNKITVGSNVLISSNVQIYTSTHPIDSKERINSNFDENEYFAKTYAQPVTIKDNAFIGGGCIILPGVTIGEGTVVGAGSVVTKSLRDHYLCYGNPCREIRKID